MFKISDVVKTKTKGHVWIGTIRLDNPIGNFLDAYGPDSNLVRKEVMGFGNPDANPLESFLDSLNFNAKRMNEYETMVFPCDENGKVKDWEDLDKANYETEEKAKKGHQKMVMKWKKQ